MTFLSVDPQVYYRAGDSCIDAAVRIFEAFARLNVSLHSCGGMAGTHDGASTWAESYDERAETISLVGESLVRTVENYAGALRTMGFNFAAAEAEAAGETHTAPARPIDSTPTPGCRPSVPPSAGGPGNGLVDRMLGLVAQVGVTVPDGDTDKLADAAKAWRDVATSTELSDAASTVTAVVDSFGDTSTPEVDHILDDLSEVVASIDAIRWACTETADSCDQYRIDIDEFRASLRGILEDLARELSVTAAVAIAASLVTFGVAAVAGTAKSAHTVSKFGRVIAESVTAWRAAKAIDRGVKVTDDLRGVRLVLERLKSPGRQTADRGQPLVPRRQLSDLFADGATPTASNLERLARSEGWTRSQTVSGPIKYVDESGVVRMTIKRGSDRAPGSDYPHVELRDSAGQRIDPFGAPVSRRSPDNHSPIEWDLP